MIAGKEDDLAYDLLDPGVRRLVRFMRRRGFATTDSGDGTREGLPGDRAHAYVAVRSSAAALAEDSRRVRDHLAGVGVKLGPVGTLPCLQATYCPADDVAVLVLTGVLDGDLPPGVGSLWLEAWGHSGEGQPERWQGSFDTRHEAIADGREQHEGAFHVVRGRRSDPLKYMPLADEILEMVGDRATDEHGEVADDFPGVLRDARDDLDALLVGWARRHLGEATEFWKQDGTPELIPEVRPEHLFCPACGAPHVDEGEWATRPHRTRRCQVPGCVYEWRPFDVPTVGVPHDEEASP